MGKRGQSEVSSTDVPVSKPKVVADAATKVVKKIKKSSKFNDEEDMYGTTSVKSDGLTWDKVSIGNLSFQDGHGLEGLVAVQVTDGRNFGKMFNGIRFQDKNMEKEYNDKLKADVKKGKKDGKEKKDIVPVVENSMILKASDLGNTKKKGGKKQVTIVEPIVEESVAPHSKYYSEEHIDYEKLTEKELAELLGLSEEPVDLEESDVDTFEGEGAFSFEGEEDEDDLLLEDEDMDLDELADLAGLDIHEGEEGEEDAEELVFDEDEEEEMEFDEEADDQFIPDFLKKENTKTKEDIKSANPTTSKKDEKKKKEQNNVVVAAIPTVATPVVPVAAPVYSIKGLNSTEQFFKKYPEYDAWLPLQLHPYIMLAIAKSGFKKPMPIQNECFLPAFRDYRDIVGAAQTGSGKTMAFGLPILQHVLQERTKRGEDHKYALKLKNEKNVYFNDNMSGLIVTPTRELAVQIVEAMLQMSQFTYINIVGVIGGVAEQKQERLLQKQPAVIVATPGRLWELMSKCLKPFDDLTMLRFFVLDEADRMVANGQFGELDNIIGYVQSFRDDLMKQEEAQAIDTRERLAEVKKYRTGKMIAVDADGKEYFNDKRKLKESAKNYVDMLKTGKKVVKHVEEELEDDNEEEEDEDEEDMIIEDTTGLFKPEDFEEQEHEYDDDEDNEEDNEEDEEDIIIGDDELMMDEDEEEDNDSEDETITTTAKPTNRSKKIQVFLFSATLTVDDDARGSRKDQKKRQTKVHRGEEVKGKSMLVALSHKLPIEFPFIVDFSSQYLLAHGLTQELIECSAEDRDVFLYAKLYEHTGRTLIFVNSINIARDLAVTLKELGLDAYSLHAQMQQKQRLQVMDKFKSEKHKNAVIVCTDVAARGLDIPNVELVIQYHLSRQPDTYIHRAGRTARAGTHGVNLNIVTPGEQLELKRLLHVLGPAGDMTKLRVNSKFIQHLRRRWKIAAEISKVHTAERVEAVQNKWQKENEDVLGIDMGMFDGEDGFANKTVKQKMSNRDKREAGKQNKWLNEQRLKRSKNDDDEDFSNAMFQAKRSRNELAAKRRDLDFYLSQKIHTKGSYFF